MKKFAYLFLSLIMAISFSSCGNKDTDKIIDTAVTYDNVDMSLYSAIDCYETVLMDAKIPNVIILEDGYDELKETIKTEFSEVQKGIKNICSQFNKDVNYSDTVMRYYVGEEVYIERTDEDILSLKLNYSDYFGGAHPNYALGGMNISPKTGEKLELKDILTDYSKFYDCFIDAFNKEYVENEDSDLSSAGFFEGYEDFFKEIYDEGMKNRWYLNSEGLVIIINPYEIAPYAAGVLPVTIPYESDIIKDEYKLNTKYTVKDINAYTETPIDIDGDDKNELLNVDFSNGSDLQISIQKEDDKITYTHEDFGKFVTEYNMKFIRTDKNKAYLYVMTEEYTNLGKILTYPFINVFSITDKEIAFVDKTKGELVGGAIPSPNNFLMANDVVVLGDYIGIANYHVGENGMPEKNNESDLYKINLDEKYVLKSIVPIMAYEHGTNNEFEIPKDSDIIPLETDGNSIFVVKTSDGNIYDFKIEKYGELTNINGEVGDFMFENIPYKY